MYVFKPHTSLHIQSIKMDFENHWIITIPVDLFGCHKLVLPLEEARLDLLPFKQFRVIAHFTELHHKVHQAVG